MDVHKEAIAVSSVVQDYGAEVVSLGTIGTRQCDLDTLIRRLHSKATHLLFVYEAGPCGYRLYRDLTKTGHDCWVVVPSFSPKNAGERVTTDRREARQRARLMRSGDLPPSTARRVMTMPSEIGVAPVKIGSVTSPPRRIASTPFCGARTFALRARPSSPRASQMARGKHANHVVVATARALVALRWALARESPLPAQPPHDACAVTERENRLKTVIGGGAALVWYTPRWREAAARTPRA
jgi:hypothetical protein